MYDNDVHEEAKEIWTLLKKSNKYEKQSKYKKTFAYWLKWYLGIEHTLIDVNIFKYK